MDDFDFLEELDDEDDEFILSDDLPLDDEFIRTHFNTCDNSVIENFPFIEDHIDAITDYELFSKGFGYLDDKKADKEELSEYAKKDEIPDVSEYVKKDTTELENYPLTSSLSDVAFSGDYDDLSDKPTIPDVSNFITKDVNDLTYYTKSSDLSTVATTGDYDDLLDKPTIPDVSNLVSFTDYASNNNTGVIKANSNFNTQVSSTTGSLYGITNTYAQYQDKDNNAFITKGTLENVITGKGLIDNTVNNLTNYTTTSSLTSLLANKENISEIGSNSNGNYIKFDNGLLICYGIISKSSFLQTSSQSTSAQNINWYRSKIASQYFPVNFINENYSVILDVHCGTTGTRFCTSDTLTKRVGYIEVQLVSVEDFTSGSNGYENLTDVSWIAIGKWK